MSMLSKGSLLTAVFDRNEFVNIDVNYYIQTNGPINIEMSEQNINFDSQFLHCVDPLSLTISTHEFGSQFQELAVYIDREDTVLTPSSQIQISDSKFENTDSDYEMLRFENIQESDHILLDTNQFMRGFITIYYGEADIIAHNPYSFNVTNSNFSDFQTNSIFEISDVANESIVSMYFENNIFRNNIGSFSLIDIDLFADENKIRFDDNLFVDNDVNNVITTDETNLYIQSSQFITNTVSKSVIFSHNGYLGISGTRFHENEFDSHLIHLANNNVMVSSASNFTSNNGSNSTIFAINGNEITISNNRFIENAPIECLNGGKLVVENSEFENNNVLSSELCGAILVRNGIDLLIENVEFTNYPNSFLCLYDSHNINISDSKFVDSNANDAGIYISNSSVQISTSLLREFESGGIYAIGKQSNLNILHSKMNLISDKAVFLDKCNEIVITNTTFDECSSTTDGGSIHALDTLSVDIDTSEFLNGMAVNNGGSVYFKETTLNVNDSTFENCTANHDGGCVFMDENSQMRLTNIEFENGKADNDGGCL
ncbi:MAG: right-handed parallel beta-helix repeat-containing protein, partial [Ketobacter sp.]|nr:right-handed parallel beta-helix repeat-containing protein [Ketobacter sp.]